MEYSAAPGLRRVRTSSWRGSRGSSTGGTTPGESAWRVADRLSLLRSVGRIGAVATADIALPSGDGARAGIAHTRWATHGAPTEANAHPHVDCSGRIAVIHNGIIENHAALRARLESQGHVFRSETDTEVIPHLVEEILKVEPDFRSAFLAAVRLLVGAYGIAAVWAGDPGAIFVARLGSPIVLGLGKDRTFVASDPAPLVAHTREVIYLDDGEIAVLRADGFTTRTLEGAPVSKEVQQIAFDLPDIERGGFPHFMLKEIAEQPESHPQRLPRPDRALGGHGEAGRRRRGGPARG